MASHEVSSSHDSQNCPSQGTSAFENGLERDEELSGDTSQAAVNLQLLEEISNHERALQEENRRLEDRLHAAELYILNLQPYLRDLTPREVGDVGRRPSPIG